MRRILFATVAVLVATTWPAGRADAVVVRHSVVDPVPAGWFVLGAKPPTTVSGARAPFYAEDDADGRALTVGTLGCDDGCPSIRGHRRPVSGLSGGVLLRNGRFRWVLWLNDQGQDSGNFVAGRDLSDGEVITAARAALTDRSGGVTGVARAALPAGLRERAVHGVGLFGIPYGAERITLLRADGQAAVDVWTYVAPPAARRAQHFWSQQAASMDGPPPSPALMFRRVRMPVLVEQGKRVSVVVGANTTPRFAHEVGRAVRGANERAWTDFRARVRDVPAGALLPGTSTLRDPFVVDGTVGELRWVAAGGATDAGPNQVYFAAITPDSIEVHKSSGLFDAGEPIPPSAICGAQLQPLLEQMGTPTPYIALGLVPAATARFTLQFGPAPPFEATTGPPTADGQHRYVWAASQSTDARVAFGTAIAYDADGNELARTDAFGNLLCP